MQNDAFYRLMRDPMKLRFFLLSKIPAAYFSGVKIDTIDPLQCTTSVPFKWFSQNPFKSTYFACLAMAAELSTGALAMANTYKRKPVVSMLVVGMEAKYFKKATDTTTFTCADGLQISAVIDQAIATGEGQTFTAKSIGKNKNGDLIAEFTFHWSFKTKKS
jgi:Domain of unknown function (DUF4442)